MDSSSTPPDGSEETAQSDPARNLLHATGDFLVGVKTQAGDDKGSETPVQGSADDDATGGESTERKQSDPAIVEPPDPGFVAPAE